MRVFYVAIFATAALFATAIARPGFTKKRHARKARSIFDNQYQQSRSNPNFDAIPTDWKYNQLDQDSVVPHYPDFSQIFHTDWQNQVPNHAGQVPQLDNDVEQSGSNRLLTQSNNQVQQEYLGELEEFAELLHHLNVDKDTKGKEMEEFLETIQHLDRDFGQNSNGDKIPPIQKTHLPDLTQQTNDQNFGLPPFTGQNINEDSTGGSSNGIEPPVHKKLVTTLGQQNNAPEVDTNNIDQYYGGQSPYHNSNQNQDFDHSLDSDSDDFSDSSFDDDIDYEDDSDISYSSESDEDSQSVEDQVGFDGRGSIDRRLGNGLDDSWAQKQRSQVRRWKRSSEPYENPAIFIEECMLVCETIRLTGKDSPVESAMCDCANAPHMK